MTVSFNLDEVKEFVESDDFTTFLVSNTDFGTAAFILQTLLDKIDQLERAEEK